MSEASWFYYTPGPGIQFFKSDVGMVICRIFVANIFVILYQSSVLYLIVNKRIIFFYQSLFDFQ